VLPTFFHSDLDRGFSIIDYDRNEELVAPADLARASELNLSFKFDLVLNHLSVNSPQFQDLLENGNDSEFRDFFIDWNEFWEGQGEMGPDGVMVPNRDHRDRLFMRKPGLPTLKVRFPDGSERPYWNTFYQEVWEEEGQRRYLGQMDLNAESEKVWEFYAETLEKLRDYGARLVRLDAFAYLHKEVGRVNFFNKPGTWEYLDRLKAIADDYDLVLLPEIHSEYGTGLHEEVSEKGFPVYDFFLPGLVIDALDRGTNQYLLQWINELVEKDLRTVNMLGCHDGIPVLDLRGMVSDPEIDAIIDRILERGGRIKNLYGADGKKVAYYQVNATYFSALGEDEQKLRLARAVQLFTPGVPQVWYLDLFAGKNDYAAADEAGAGGHKEINRTTLTLDDIEAGLKKAVVRDQLDLLRLRNTSPAFQGGLQIAESERHLLDLTWRHDGYSARLRADLRDHSFAVTQLDPSGDEQRLSYSG
jgi:sucrose phosphorylase